MDEMVFMIPTTETVTKKGYRVKHGFIFSRCPKCNTRVRAIWKVCPICETKLIWTDEIK